MATLNIDEAFKRIGNTLRFTDDVLTSEEMLAGTDEMYPDGYAVIHKETKKWYVYIKDATPTQTTGKFTEMAGGGGSGGTSDYLQLLNKPKINGVELTGDKSLDDLGVQAKINDAISGITSFTYEVVANLPTTGEKGKIYLIENTSGEYDEYIWLEGNPGKFEKIGSVNDIDLSNYYNKTETDTLLSAKASKDYLDTELAKKEEKATVFNLVDEYTERQLVEACQKGNVYMEENGIKRKIQFYFYNEQEHDTRITVQIGDGKYKEYQFGEGVYSSYRLINIIPSGGKAGQVLAKRGGDTLNNEWIDLPAGGLPTITSGTSGTDKFFGVEWNETNPTLGTDKTLQFNYNPTFYGCVQMFVDKGGSTSSQDYGVTVNLPTKEYVDSKVGVKFKINSEEWYGRYTDENNVTYQVYTKTIFIPSLPATAGITNYDHGITDIRQILSVYGFTTDGFVLNAPRQTVSDNITIYQAKKAGSIAIEVGKDRSSKSAYVTIIYTKNN